MDGQLQGSLLGRIALYWLTSLTAALLLSYCWYLVQTPSSGEMHLKAFCKQFLPGILGAFLLLPIVMVDALRWSNKIAGPLIRIHKALDNISSPASEEVKLRSDDYLQDLAAAVNQVKAQLALSSFPRSIGRREVCNN